MKRASFLFAAVALFFSCALALEAQTNVRVLTYNIHRDIGASDSNISSQPALAKVVNYLKPDIWAINELGGNNASFNPTTARSRLVTFIHDQLSIFGANPQENVNYFIYIGTIDDGYITEAIVSRYSFASTHTYSDAGNGFGSLRGLVSASVNIPGTIKLDVFAAHLKALNTTTDAEKRQTEADVDRNNVINWMSAHAADSIIVTGDWNETEDAGEATNWSGHQIGDLLPNPNEPYHPIATVHSAGLIDPSPLSIAGNHDTIDSTSPDARFDYTMYARMSFLNGQIFDTKQYTSTQLAALNAANGTNFIASDSADASDHLPVLSVFQIGGTPPAPVLIKVAREGANLSVTYQKIAAPNFTYTIEGSNDLVSWTARQTQDQVLDQNGDTQTVKSSVAIGGANKLFLRVRVTITP
ncbi:MAG: endonuclease/exonuclease/phosphatase family protein [Verrucomicrobiota bacterium]